MPRPAPSRLPRGLLGAIVAAAALLAASPGDGLAQADEPLRLTPIEDVGADEAGPTPGTDVLNPAPLATTADETAEPAVQPEAADVAEPAGAAQDDGGVVVGTLDAIDPDAAGVMLPGIAPFAPDMWAGSRRSRIEALLPRLPAAARSSTVRRLALALLTSPVQPPAGAGEAGALALARAERLAAMGARGHALALLERAGPPGGKEAIARIRNDRQLAALDYDGACEGISSKAGRIRDGHWRRVGILCQVRAGLIEAATLSLDLLQESDVPPDPPFDDTIYAMVGLAEPDPGRFDRPTPLHIAAWRLARFPIPAAATLAAAPDVLPAIVEAPESPPETRLLAVSEAWITGVLPIEAVRGLYMQVAFTPEERAAALDQIAGLEPVLASALMMQAIEAQTEPALRAELLAATLTEAERQGSHGLAAHVLVDLLRTVPPAPEYAWFSGAAGRALIAAGDRDAAAVWYGLARERAPRDPEAVRSAVRLWPLMLLSDDEPQLTAAEFEAWLVSEEGEGDAVAAIARTNLLVILLDALGARIEPGVWDRLLTDWHPAAGPGSLAIPVRSLTMATEEGRFGETVLMALVLLGEAGPAVTGLATVGPVVSGLAAVGLREEARAIALEAALAAGL